MRTSLRSLIAALLAGAALLAPAGQARAESGLKHKDVTLKEETVKKATARIAEIKKDYHKDLLFEVLGKAPDDDLDRWARAQIGARDVNRVYIVLVRSPEVRVYVVPDKKTESRA